MKRLRLIFAYLHLLCSQSRMTYMIIGCYVLLVLTVINWGIPNSTRLFTYHMDEWHQMMAVTSLATEGSNNVPGAAHGPVLPFLMYGAFLGLMVVAGVIDPNTFDSPIQMLHNQQVAFVLGRGFTLIVGVITLLLFSLLLKQHFKLSSYLGLILFAFTPIWVSLSNFLKYDIIVSFWLVCFIFFALLSLKTKSVNTFIITGVIAGLGLASKFSLLPLVPLYAVVFALLLLQGSVRWSDGLKGLIGMFTVFCMLGIPDYFLGKGDYSEFLSSNLVTNPQLSQQFDLGMSVWSYLALKQFPLLFGHGLSIVFAVCLLYSLWLFIYLIMEHGIRYLLVKRTQLVFLLTGFFGFVCSLIPLQLYATSNRALVLLPWIILIVVFTIDSLVREFKIKSQPILITCFSVLFLLQMTEVISWQYLKLQTDTRVTASYWLKQELPTRALIAVEQPPIYQRLPDVINNDIYARLYSPRYKARFHYLSVTKETTGLPEYVVLTQQDVWQRYQGSDQSLIVAKMQISQYEQIAKFEPHFGLLSFIAEPFDIYTANLVPVATITVWQKQY